MLLQLRDHRVELVLLALVLVELLVEKDNLRLIIDFLPLIKCLFEHDTISLVLQLAVLMEVRH